MGPPSRTCFVMISPRTATLLLAIVGIVAHLNAYSWLTTLSQTFPDVPERLDPAFRPPPSAARFADLVDTNYNYPTQPSRYHLAGLSGSSPHGQEAYTPDKVNGASGNSNLPAWLAEAKAYLKSQGFASLPSAAEDEPSPASSSGGTVASSSLTSTKPKVSGDRDGATSNSNHLDSGNKAISSSSWQFFNVLPHATAAGYFDDGAEDEERFSWDAMRLVATAMRIYIALSIVCCCAGVLGVLKSHLLLSRLFVIHSFLDFFLSTLSLFSLALLCTYPSVRSHICEEFGSGEFQAFFSPSLEAGSPSVQIRAAHDGGPRVTEGSDSQLVAGASWWDLFVDGVFGAENCEESFATTLVPILMIIGLAYTALRIQCFLMVQKFYRGLLKDRIAHYGYALSSGRSSPRDWKDVDAKLLD